MHLFFGSVGGDETESQQHVVATALVSDPEQVRKEMESLRKSLLVDRFRSRVASVRNLANRSFNFTEDHPSVRAEVINLLRNLAFRSSVWFSDKKRSKDPLAALLTRALTSSVAASLRMGNLEVNVYVDSNTDVELDKTDMSALTRNKTNGNPIKLPALNAIRVYNVHNDDHCMAIPNYVACVIRDAMDDTSVERAAAQAYYQNIAHRIGTVVDATNGVSYLRDAFWGQLQRIARRQQPARG